MLFSKQMTMIENLMVVNYVQIKTINLQMKVPEKWIDLVIFVHANELPLDPAFVASAKLYAENSSS